MLMLDPAGTVKVVHTGYTEELKASLENEVRGHLGLPPLPPPAPDKPVEVTPAKGKPAKAPSKAPSKG